MTFTAEVRIYDDDGREIVRSVTPLTQDTQHSMEFSNPIVISDDEERALLLYGFSFQPGLRAVPHSRTEPGG